MEIYERYASLFLHSNATFLCERAHAEVRTAASLEALASCYLRQGAAKRAYAVLCGCASSANGRYLLAVACYKLDKLAEADIVPLKCPDDCPEEWRRVIDISLDNRVSRSTRRARLFASSCSLH